MKPRKNVSNNTLALFRERGPNTVILLKQCVIKQGWIFPLVGFAEVLNLLRVDFGSAIILDSGDGAGQGL